MELRRRLATAFCAANPGQAAIALEGRPASEVAGVLEFLGAEVAAKVVTKTAPGMARRVLEALDPPYAARIVEHVPLEVAAAVLRALHRERREQMLGELEPGLAADLGRTVESPPGTAGALMDPRAVALSQDVTVSEALQTLRDEGQHALFNIYVVDRDGLLVGVFNLQELLLAPAGDKIATVLKPVPHRLAVTADRQAIVEHEGWRAVYSLPVVDEQNRYVGAIRYQTLRRLEAAPETPSGGGVTASALGDLFRTGIGGLIEALSGEASPPTANEDQRRLDHESDPQT